MRSPQDSIFSRSHCHICVLNTAYRSSGLSRKLTLTLGNRAHQRPVRPGFMGKNRSARWNRRLFERGQSMTASDRRAAAGGDGNIPLLPARLLDESQGGGRLGPTFLSPHSLASRHWALRESRSWSDEKRIRKPSRSRSIGR